MTILASRVAARYLSASKTQKLWKEIEAFLYPDWYRGSGYRGDLHYTPEVREIQEFYQNYSGDSELSTEDFKFMEGYLRRSQKATDAEWAVERKSALESIRELDDPSHFTAGELRAIDPKAAQKLDHLVGDGDVERRGTTFSLAR